jgi:hypothetical protein
MKRQEKLSSGALISADGRKALAIKQPQEKITHQETLIIQDGLAAEEFLKIEEGFNFWWKAYDYNAGRAECRKIWAGMKTVDRQKCLDVVTAYVASATDKKWRKLPKKYLEAHAWEDEIVNFKKDSAKPALGSVANLGGMDYDKQLL